jgi:hypothetical protein
MAKHSKVEEIYGSLGRKEKESLRQFLSCKAINASPNIVSCHDFISNAAVDNENGLDKKALFAFLFGEKETYSDGKLRVLITRLIRLVENYLIYQHIDQSPISRLNILDNYYKKNHLIKNRTMLFSSQETIEGASYDEILYYNYTFAERKLDSIYNHDPNNHELIYACFEESKAALEKLQQFQVVKSLCDVLSFGNRYKSDLHYERQEAYVRSLMRKRDQLDRIINSYISIYLLLKNIDEAEFHFLYQHIRESELNRYESNYIGCLTHLQNFCIRLVNNGKTEYLVQLFEINNLKLQFVKKEGDLSSASFRNIVYCAIQLKKIDWAEQFVESYHTKVAEIEQENSYNFNIARIFFEKKDYKSAMRTLLKVTYEDAFYAITARILLLKSYFELEDETPLMSCCYSLNFFLMRNNTFTKQRIDNYKKFLYYTKKIFKNRLKGNKKFMKSLKLKMEQVSMVEKDWLIEKVNHYI